MNIFLCSFGNGHKLLSDGIKRNYNIIWTTEDDEMIRLTIPNKAYTWKYTEKIPSDVKKIMKSDIKYLKQWINESF